MQWNNPRKWPKSHIAPAGIKSLVSALKRDLDADLITESCRAFSGAYAVLLCFEKYYFRNNSYAGLTIMLTEEQENQTADIIGFGGGNGLFNFSLGANSNFADTAKSILENYGFQEYRR